MLMWVMSDRAHPAQLPDDAGLRRAHLPARQRRRASRASCKFHWKPVAGTHSLVWDEAVKISGADPDFHRRDLWEAIEAGAYPGVGARPAGLHRGAGRALQLRRPRRDQDRPRGAGAGAAGRHAWCSTATRTTSSPRPSRSRSARRTSFPGIDFTNDPLLQGRIHSYVDTQLIRLGGPNFHEIPINAPVAQVHNNQRDGMHRQAIQRGRVAYEPNSLGGGCPFQAGMRGFVSFPQPVEDDKVRGKPEKFADHYTQATLFWESQTPDEKTHIIRAFRFELTKVQAPGDPRARGRDARQRRRPSSRRASPTASASPCRRRMPRVLETPPAPEVTTLAGAVADGAPGRRQRQDAPRRDPRRRRRRRRARCARSMPRSPQPAPCRASSARASAACGPVAGEPIDVEVTMETMPSVLWDGVVDPGRATADLAAARPGGRVRQGPVPPLQDDPRPRRQERAGRAGDAADDLARRQRRRGPRDGTIGRCRQRLHRRSRSSSPLRA